MLFVVNKANDEILFRADAWYVNATRDAKEFIINGGYTYIDQEITFNGDMVIWVK